RYPLHCARPLTMLPTHHRRPRAVAWFGALFLAVSAGLIPWQLGQSTQIESAQDLDKATVAVSPELVWVQPDAALFVTVRVGDLWRSPDGKILRDQFAQVLEEIDRSAEREVGLRLEQIEQLTFVIPDWSMIARGG